jgi:RNA polymerase sigma-54 factor
VSAAHAEAIAVYIRANLNMYPAAAHWGEAAPPPSEAFFAPDVIITRHNADPDGPLVVEIISPFAGNLHLTHGFKEAVNAQIQVAQAAAQDSAASYRVRQAAEAELEKCEALSAQTEKAQLLIKCLQQRDFTLTRLLQRLVVLQRSFILDGDAESVPVTRAQLALELGLNESTISRAVADKAVQLPNGRIIELAGMFDRSLHIRTALRALIEQEDRPLSDHALANLLSAQGFPVARRTVAKYRKLEGLHPARLRRGRVAAA